MSSILVDDTLVTMIDLNKQIMKDMMLLRMKLIGPSGVRALPVAAGINIVAIVLGIIFLSSLRGCCFTTRKKAARVLKFFMHKERIQPYFD